MPRLEVVHVSTRDAFLDSAARHGLLIAVAVCGGSDEPELPDATAASVLANLEEMDYQQSWELWPGKGEKYEGGEPHGMLLTTYLNPAAYDALDGKDGVMPNGAILGNL
jgi:hypothetical protein